MANENVPDPAPIRSDDQILPFAAWVPIGKSNYVLDLQKTSLEITPIDQAYQFMPPPSGDAIMDFVNELGYTEVIYFVSRMAARYLVIQMLWGIITSTNVDYAERIREEFVQAIQTFLSNKAILGSPTKKGRKDKPHFIPYCRFTKLIICYLGRIHNIHQRSASPFHLAEEDLRLGNLKFISKGKVDEVFGMPIPNELISNNIRNVPYYNAYLEMDKRLRDLIMMILVRQTEEYDMMLYMVKTDMLMLVAEIDVGDKTADDVDKLVCSADVVKSRQVDQNVAHASIKLQ
nr:hypothetical protein [Tanacetum cinerariifolium]